MVIGKHVNMGALTFSAFMAFQPVFCIFLSSFFALTMPTKSDATSVSLVANATVKSPQRLRFSVVACAPIEIIISWLSHVPAHAAFIALGWLFWLYVPIISTGCGISHAFCPKFLIFSMFVMILDFIVNHGKYSKFYHRFALICGAKTYYDISAKVICGKRKNHIGHRRNYV